MNSISVQDKSFNIESAKEHTISIQLSLNGFSFLITNPAEEKYKSYFFEPLPNNIGYDDFVERAVDFLHKDIFSGHFGKVNIINASFQTLLLPEAVFKTENLKKLFEVNHNLKDDEFLLSNKFQGTYLVFSISSYLSSTFVNKFKDYTVYNQAYPLLYQLAQYTKNSSEEIVWVQIINGFFDVIVYRKSELIFFNSFQYKNVNDYIYFLMNVFEQLKLKPLKTKLLISGNINHSSAYLHSAKTFIQNVALLTADEKFDRFSQNLIDRHFFTQNANLFLL